MMSSYFISKLRSLDSLLVNNNSESIVSARAIVSELLCEATITTSNEINNSISSSEVSATGLILVNKKVSATEKSNFLAKLAEFDYCNEH